MSKLDKKDEPIIKRVGYTKEEFEKCKSELVDFSIESREAWLLNKKAIRITNYVSHLTQKPIKSISVLMDKEGNVPYHNLMNLWEATLVHYSRLARGQNPADFPTEEPLVEPGETGALAF